jgi:hypothetical protein
VIRDGIKIGLDIKQPADEAGEDVLRRNQTKSKRMPDAIGNGGLEVWTLRMEV